MCVSLKMARENEVGNDVEGLEEYSFLQRNCPVFRDVTSNGSLSQWSEFRAAERDARVLVMALNQFSLLLLVSDSWLSLLYNKQFWGNDWSDSSEK